MASFSLFPKIESEEERQRREERLLKKPSKSGLSLSSVESDTAAPALQRQLSNPSLQLRSDTKTNRSAPQHRSKRPVAPALRTSVSSPGLYSPPSPRTDPLPALPKPAANANQRASPSKSSKHPPADTAVMPPATTPSPATTRSSSSTFSPASTRSSSYSVIYPTIPTAQSPIIKPSPPKERTRQKMNLGALPPPPPLPLPPNKMLVRANTTATHQSSNTLRSGASSSTYTSANRAHAKSNSQTTYAGGRSIFPVFDPNRPFAEQQREYTLTHHPTATYRRALTQKALEESQHEFSAPPSYHGPRSVGSGITRVSTVQSLKSSYPIKQRSSADLPRQYDCVDDKKNAAVGITAGTALIVSQQHHQQQQQQQIARPSTSSSMPGATKQKDATDSQHGVSAALDACAFVFGVGVEVVGGAVGGLRRGVRKERAKRQRRDDRRASKKASGQKETVRSSEDEENGADEDKDKEKDKNLLPWPRQRPQRSPSPGWLVGEGGPRRVTDFRI